MSYSRTSWPGSSTVKQMPGIPQLPICVSHPVSLLPVSCLVHTVVQYTSNRWGVGGNGSQSIVSFKILVVYCINLEISFKIMNANGCASCKGFSNSYWDNAGTKPYLVVALVKSPRFLVYHFKYRPTDLVMHYKSQFDDRE